jgi:hypothetical protein
VGLGFRVEVAADLLADPGAADFVEVVAESCFANPAAHREAVALSRVWPVVPHGVKLSLGSAEGIEVDRARRLGALARELGAPVVTEHVAFTRAGGRDIGHLTQVPLTRETVRVVARNVATARRHLPDVPFLLENPAWTFRWPGDELDEATFFQEIAAATGCGLLLDLGNLHANALNAGADPRAVLDAYPLDRVAMIHLAGGVTEDGFYFDTHAHPVPDPVFALLDRFVARAGPVPVVLERDDEFPPFDQLRAELSRARQALAGPAADEMGPPSASRGSQGGGEAGRSEESLTSPPPRLPGHPPSSTRGAPLEVPASVAMARAQARLAVLLTAPEEPDAAEALPFGPGALRRSREVLRQKRVDDALPILGNLVPHRDAVRALARACLAAAPRAPALAGVADALRIARAAAEDPRLATAARLDLLVLRSRFVGPADDGSLRARVGPFVGRERLPGGRVVWAVKAPGGSAGVRVFETRG